MGEAIFLQQNTNPNSTPWDIRDYARYVLTNKNAEEKRELFSLFRFPLFIQNRNITPLSERINYITGLNSSNPD
jgi:hypothetical protein